MGHLHTCCSLDRPCEAAVLRSGAGCSWGCYSLDRSELLTCLPLTWLQCPGPPSLLRQFELDVTSFSCSICSGIRFRIRLFILLPFCLSGSITFQSTFTSYPAHSIFTSWTISFPRILCPWLCGLMSWLELLPSVTFISSISVRILFSFIA